MKNNVVKKISFCTLFTLVLCLLGYFIFLPIYISDNIIIPYSFKPYNICIKYPSAWDNIKLLFLIFYLLSSILISKKIYHILNKIFKFKIKNNNKIVETTTNNNELFVKLSNINFNSPIIIPEKSLYQNILITGTIGSGKTSSCMYPFTEQLISFQASTPHKKLGMLILDVKGNYYKMVENYCRKYNRISDLYIIELGGKYKYNPLDKPNLKPSILADRLKTILTLFSQNNYDSYWLDMASQVLTESIKLCRLYNNNYVTFQELHKLISNSDYFNEKIISIRNLFLNNKLSKEKCFDALSSINFFENEFNTLDLRTSSIIKSEISRITNLFVSDYEILNTFSPSKDKINFKGFKSIINKGKIVVLKMNIAENKNLAKIIATYMKLDFQTEVMSRLKHCNNDLMRSVAFICDEFHEYVTTTDADFFSESREAKCINIVATQSYSSLMNTLNNQYSLKVIIQNLINKIWFRTDDTFTIEDIQKQLGKEDKIKYSKTISENAKETQYSYFTNTLNSKNSNISESINKFTQLDYIYDSKFFSQHLKTFSCLAFLSDGEISHTHELTLIPYFKQKG